MSRVIATPWARAAIGTTGLEVLRTRIPIGASMLLGANSPGGPFHVRLLVDGSTRYDEWHRDIHVGCGEALALLPTDLEAQLAASLRAVGQ